ncbi:MAG: methyltransferase domain-containing protein [Proteobacteria bacterium]|nr:methyltransferase domain-containing protein [Pseudomonadota bacterium]
MRVIDLDRDMSDVIPTGLTPDSQFLFARMTDVTLDLAGAEPGRRILDVASGVGQDAVSLAVRGAAVVGAEPSARMSGMARLFAEGDGRREGALPSWVRAWSDALPFATGSFDAVICKGAIDHFDRPEEAVAEMARVTRPTGRVVLAIANFESLACRVARARDELRERLLPRPPRRGRRGYDAPSDHFTRYELDLMREQASRHLDLEVVEGVSLGWGMPGWSQALRHLPSGVARGALQALDWIARRAPAWADVAVLAGRPRRSATISL